MDSQRQAPGIAAAVALVLAAAVVPPATAAPHVGPLMPLSGVDVAPGCAPETPPQIDRNQVYPKDTAVAPHVAVDPRDPRRIAAAWMQDFSKAHVVASSGDGGRTWRRSVPPGTSECTGGPKGDLPFDPWLAWGTDGILHLSGMRLIVRAGRTTPDNAVVVNRSADGGRTWSDAVVAVPRDGFNDHPTIAADPDRPERLYLAWQVRNEPFGANSPGAYLKISDDGGRTWSATRTIYTPPRAFYTIFGGIIAAAPGGRVAFMFVLADNQSALPGVPQVPLKIVVVSSADGGQTWSPGTVVAEQAYSNDSEDPDSGEVAISGVPGFAASPRGEFLLAWHDVATQGEDRIWRVLFASSPDGEHWSKPRDVAPPGRPQLLLPHVAGTRAGRVAVVWYDTEPDRRGDEAFTAQGRIAIARSSTASFERAPVGMPFDLRQAYKDPRGGARFLGDYIGIAARGENFFAAMPFSPPIARMGQVQVFGVETGAPHEAPRRARLRLSVRPIKTRVGRRTRFRFRVSYSSAGRRRAVRRAVLRFAGRRVRTGRGGRAVMTVRFREPGTRFARASKRNFRSGRAPVRVLPSGR